MKSVQAFRVREKLMYLIRGSMYAGLPERTQELRRRLEIVKRYL